MQKALAEHLSVGDTYRCLTDSQSQDSLRILTFQKDAETIIQ